MHDDICDQNGGIDRCPSTPHRSVLGLLRAALGHPVGPGMIDDLGASTPEDIVRIATFNYVHVVVATAFDRVPELGRTVPDDMAIYFREMQAANLRRNEAILDELRSVGAALVEVGIRGVALKGAAELLDPVFPEPAFRFLSDIDILVPEGDIERAAARLRALGAMPTEISDVDRGSHHHLEPLLHPDWPVPVELHRSLGQGELHNFLAPEVVFATACTTRVPGLMVPSRAHRLAHAVQHAQLQPPRYRDGVLSLRDAVEMEVMAAGLEPDEVTAARACFRGEWGAAWEALAAARALIFGDAAQIAAAPPAARRWAEIAVDRFGRPGQRRFVALGQWVGWYAKEFFVNPARRRHYLGQLKRPSRILQKLAEHRDRWFRTR